MQRQAQILDERFVKIGRGWTRQMREMADHIGAYPTLLLSAIFGGRVVYISADPKQNILREVVGPEAAHILSHVYRRERIAIPTARTALAVARRGPVLAAVRRGALSKTEAAKMLGTSRSYLPYLINQTNEAIVPVTSD